MTANELSPIDPRTAMEMWIDHRANDVTQATLRGDKSDVRHFVKWCEGTPEQFDEPNCTNLNELDGRDLFRFRSWRSNQLQNNSLNKSISTVRTFLSFCEDIEAVRDGLFEKLKRMDTDHEAFRREAIISPERATKALERLSKFQYASWLHVALSLMWHGGLRIGAVRAIDVGDIDLDEQLIELKHRPEEDTPLKNGARSERPLVFDEEHARLLRDYLAENRSEVTDEYGREPLIPGQGGRRSIGSIRENIQNAILPCQFGACPHDRDPATCEHANRIDKASDCPSGLRPHDIRRGAITHWRNKEVPVEVVSDRMDLTPKTLEKHYDQRTEMQRAEVRRGYLDNV